MPNTRVEDNYLVEKLQPADEIVIPQDDLYTFSWEVDFDYELFETRKDVWPLTATRLPNDAASSELEYHVTEDERSSAHEEERSSEKNESRPRPVSRRDLTSPLNEPPGRGSK